MSRAFDVIRLWVEQPLNVISELQSAECFAMKISDKWIGKQSGFDAM
jgi:hypothetical protein